MPSLGLISIEQNAAMKLFSWAALVFLPPTLMAGVYGMNFEYMPELKWLHGYPLALALMVASAVLPLWYFKRRGWISDPARSARTQQHRRRIGVADDRDCIDRVRRHPAWAAIRAAGKRRISQREMAGDFDSVAIVLVEHGGTRFGGAAAEIFAIMGHARILQRNNDQNGVADRHSGAALSFVWRNRNRFGPFQPQ